MPTQNFKVGEMLPRRTVNSKTWINFDGSYTTEIHSGPVHFEDENGNWQNINTDLYDEADFDVIDEPVAKEGKERFWRAKEETKAAKQKNVMNRSNHNFQALRVPFDAHIPRNFKRGYTVGKGQDKLTFKPVKSSPSMGEPSETDRSVIVYQDVWNDTDVELKVQPTGLKETLILKTDRAPVKFAFEVKGKDIAEDFTAGGLKLMPAWLVDAAGTERDVPMVINRQNDNKVYVELAADVTDLVYPIAIDPTVMAIGGPTSYQDSGGDDSYALETDGDVRVGHNQGKSTFYQAFTTFDAEAMPALATVNSAAVHFGLRIPPNDIDLADNRMILRTRLVTSVRDSVDPFGNPEKDPTFENYPRDEDSVQFTPTSPYGAGANHQLTVTNLVKEAISRNLSFIGIYWDAETFTANRKEMRIAPQRVEITYLAPPGAPTVTVPNGGESWNSLHAIAWTSAVDVDTDASLLRHHVQLSTDNGASWRDLASLTSPGTSSYSYDFINEPETSTALIRVRAYDGTSYGPWDTSDGVFTIVHNIAPNAPSGLAPANGTPTDQALVNRLSWQHSDPNAGDPQAQFDLQWRAKGAATWTTVTQASPQQYWDAPANTFPRGEIEWRVRTYDQAGLSSPYSTTALFYASEAPAVPTITSPADGATVAIANPVVQWSSVGQVAYRLTVKQDGATVWTIEQASTNKAVTVGADLDNRKGYTIELSIKNADGLWSDPVTIGITVSYTPPAAPTIAVSAGDSYIAVDIHNPAPSGIEPEISGNDLYKRESGTEAWTRIAVGIPGSQSYRDYAVASAKSYEYKVRAQGVNNTAADSESDSGNIKLNGVYLHSVQDPEMTLKRYLMADASGRSSSKEAEHQYMQFAGRKKRVIEYGEVLNYGVSAGIRIKRDDDGAERLEGFVENTETVCYRDGRGRLLFGAITAAPITDTQTGWETTINISEIDYSEEV